MFFLKYDVNSTYFNNKTGLIIVKFFTEKLIKFTLNQCGNVTSARYRFNGFSAIYFQCKICILRR